MAISVNLEQKQFNANLVTIIKALHWNKVKVIVKDSTWMSEQSYNLQKRFSQHSIQASFSNDYLCWVRFAHPLSLALLA